MDWFKQMWNWLMNCLPEHIHADHVTEYLPRMVIMSFVIGLLAAAMIVALLALLNKYRKGKWTISGKSLTVLFCVTWLLGFIVYEIGIYTGGPLSLFLNAPMAMIHAFEMFILENDVAAIHHEFHNNLPFMSLFSMVHFLAAAVSMIFVIRHFGFNIVAGFRMFFEAYFKKKRKETFVFWGMNEPSFLLAQSIKQKLKNTEDYRIVVIRTGNDSDSTGVRNGMERLLNFRTLKNKDLERLQELGCLTTSTFVNLSKLNESELCDGNQSVDILKKLNLRQLSKMISSKTTSAIHIFFLGEDASTNIQCIANLKYDKNIRDFAKAPGSMVRFYCRARWNSVHRVIEDDHLLDRVDVRVVDSSRISIEQLKQDVSLHPVNYVNIEDDATVSSPFNALVVGFGEVGIDAVRFLYEFGAFVKRGTATGSKVKRSDFHCNVIDTRMPNIAGPFLANAPGISTEMILRDGTRVSRRNNPEEGDDPLVSLHELDMKSVEFYKKLEVWVKTLNYIVIATDDSEQNMSLAVRAFKLAVMYRKNLDHFRILACVKNDNDGHIRRTAEHYNRLWAAELVGVANNTPLHQKEVKTNARVDAPITVFGLSETIYTYDYIINEKLVEEAKKFKERYDRSIAALRKQMGEEVEESKSWDDEYKELMQLDDQFQGFSPTYSGMTRLRRIQTQNRQNCLHLFTKRQLTRKALDKETYDKLLSSVLLRKDNSVKYICQDGSTPDPKIVAVLDVLARTEHLRWCASHEILGYRDEGDVNFKNEAKLLHGCIKPWESLPEAVQSYDYNIVDVSLGIIKNGENPADNQ